MAQTNRADRHGYDNQILTFASTFASIARRALVVLAGPSSERERLRARQAHATVPRRFLAMGSLLDALAYRRHHAATSTKTKFWPRCKTWRCFPHWDGTGNPHASQYAQPHGVAEWLPSTAKRHANEWFCHVSGVALCQIMTIYWGFSAQKSPQKRAKLLIYLEARLGIEPGYTALQAVVSCLDSTTYGTKPLRLPLRAISHSRTSRVYAGLRGFSALRRSGCHP